MKKALTLLSGLVLMFQILPVMAAPPQEKIKSFTEWCQEKDSVPIATKQTIEVLLAEAGTKNCQEASSKLGRLNSLMLNHTGISDLKPLSSLINLRNLNIFGSKISDVKPLANMINLTRLAVSQSKISDLKPLANMTNLTLLWLDGNKVSDLKPLARLTNLADLDLSRNEINDIKPLANMTNLTRLNLYENKVTKETCPSSLILICKKGFFR
jgi:internalin A